MADLIILNAKVWTGPGRPTAEAIAVSGDRISAVDATAAVRRLATAKTRVIDAAGRLVVPGFIDAHVHLMDGGFSLRLVSLRASTSEEQMAAMLRDHVAALARGKWVTGGGWDHESWPSHQLPTRQLIDPVTPANPVLVRRVDGHMSLANSLALKQAGIDRRTPDPPGGKIYRDDRGEPTGILVDSAQYPVARLIPGMSETSGLDALRAGMSHAATLGLTSVHASAVLAEFRLMQRLRKDGDLPIRIYALIGFDDPDHMRGLASQMIPNDPFLRARGVKMLADGSLGASSALLFEPYSDNPKSSGLAIHREDDLYETVRQADAAGLQVALHAIGDKAVHWVLNAFERAAAANGRRDARHRIEHSQTVRPDDRPRYARLGVVASIQPSHAIDDMRWAEKRLGHRISYAYPFRSLLEAGARVALGTDWPIEPLDPMLGLYAAVTREATTGGPAGGWCPAEKVTMEQALEAYTLGPAYAEFQETVKGTIQPGRLADMVVLSKDLLTIPPREILQTRADVTLVGGRVVFERTP